MTWGRRDGDQMNPDWYPSFTEMQAELATGYMMYRDAISTPERPVLVAPVGLAFEAIYESIVEEGDDPLASGSDFVNLYSGDGSHSSQSGTYLAACVIYATIIGRDPQELNWMPSGMNEDDRDRLQEFAWKTAEAFSSKQHTAAPCDGLMEETTLSTQEPTLEPTQQPSEMRTAYPTFFRTALPTNARTAYPTLASQLSNFPSAAPTNLPTNTSNFLLPTNTTNIQWNDTTADAPTIAPSIQQSLIDVDVELCQTFVMGRIPLETAESKVSQSGSDGTSTTMRLRAEQTPLASSSFYASTCLLSSWAATIYFLSEAFGL